MVERYSTRTQPQAADVAQPGPSPLKALVGFANEVAAPVLQKLDSRARSLEQASLNAARLKLSQEGLALELSLQKKAGVAGDGYVPSVQAQRQALKQKVWAQVPESVRKSERASAAWEDLWTQDHDAATKRATLWQSDQQTSFAVRSLNDDLAARTSTIEVDPAAAQDQLQQFRESLVGYSGLLTKDQLAEAGEKGFQQIMLASVRGLANQGKFEDAETLIRTVGAKLGIVERNALQSDVDQIERKRQGETAEAFEARNIAGKLKKSEIEAGAAAGDISQGQANALELQRQAMIERAAADVARAKAAAQSAQIAASKANKDQIAYGLLTGDATEADVHVAIQEGRLLLDDGNELIRAARAGQGKANKAGLVRDALAAGSPLDPYNPDTREGIDALWEADGGVQAFTQEQTSAEGGYKINAGTSMVLTYAHQAGVVPPAAASALQGMATNGNDEQKQTAFDAVAQLWDKNPGAASAAFPDTADRVLRDALSWRLKTKAGIDPVAALRAVERENEVQAAPVIKQRQAEAAKAAGLFTPDAVRDQLKQPALLPWDGGAPAFAPGADAEALSMFREAFATEYVRTGDPKVALELAGAAVKRTIGRTSVGAAPSTIAYPPELFYATGLEQANPDWLNEDLVAGVREIVEGGDIPGTAPGTEVRAQDLRIIPDTQTAREAREKLPPSYIVEWKGEVLDQRWRFDPGKAVNAARLKAELEANDKKRQGELQRAVAGSGWNPYRNTGLPKYILGETSIEGLEARGRTLEKGPKAATASDLFGQIGTINKKYDEQATSLRAMFGDGQ